MGVQFSPALGLFPWNASAGQSWNATSAFTAQGGWNDSYTYVDTLRGITSSSSGSSSGSVSHYRNEWVRGKDLGNVTLKNGMNATIVVIGYLGPFAFGDGLFLTEARRTCSAAPAPDGASIRSRTPRLRPRPWTSSRIGRPTAP